MKIALLGYGKMGKIIEEIATGRKHEIVLKVNSENLNELTTENLQSADVIIEFSKPSVALINIDKCFGANVPVVVGTTGWYAQLEEVRQRCEMGDHALLYGTNFSVGVNILFHVNKVLAKLMNNYPYYDVQLEEIHHTHKLDSPSGTAITLANGIIENIDKKNKWSNVLVTDENRNDVVVNTDELLIESYRMDSVPGTHTVIYDSEVDSIELKHTAHNRDGFALGAVLAAEWLMGKKGFFSVNDMFNFGIQ